MNPKISFIIPVYNVEEYLEQCLDSLINQTLDNIEIICVDDGSTDESYEILKTYQKKDSRIRLFKQENSGQGKARNLALDNAKGEYILFVDSDDWIDINASKELYDLIKKEDLDVLMFHAINYDDETDYFFETKYYNNAWFPQTFDEQIFSFDDVKDYVFSMACTPYSKIYKRSFIEEYNIRFPLGLFFEDYPFHCEVLLMSKRTRIFRKNFYYRRRRVDSVTAEVDDTYFDTVEISNIVTNVFKKHNLYYKYIDLILNRKIEYLIYCYGVISDEYKNGYIKLILDDLNKIKSNKIENEEFLSNLEGINKYFYQNLTKKMDFNELNFLLSSYDFNEDNKNIKYIDEFNVAVILDPLSYNSYSPEFNAFPIEPDNWLDIFKKNQIVLFFCESAFDGVRIDDMENGIAIENKSSPWRGNKIIYCNRDKEHTISNIIKYCNEHDIPTIFWNKENPHAFDEFIDVALKFDYIFTTDEDSIVKYYAKGHKEVYQLLFASQINLYNPIEKTERSNDVVFAGSWYSWFTNRCNVMHDLFRKILSSEYGLKIYNRHSIRAEKMPGWQFPEEYLEYVNPGVSSDKMADVYKESKFSLNINSITSSPTMFARRVFELMSSNTFVISNFSKGVYNLFGNNVLYLDNLDSLSFDCEEVKKVCEENLYDVLENHTYYNRFKYILNTICIPFKERKYSFYIIYMLKSNSNFKDILEDFNSLSYFYKHCIIVTEDLNLLNKNYDDFKIINFQDLINFDEFLEDNDFFMFRNLNDKLENDFCKKAFLHYNYLKIDYGITQNSSKKYTLYSSFEYNNIIFNAINFKKVLNNISKVNSEELVIYPI